MRGSRFQAEPLAESWLNPVDCRELAKLCQGAGLTQVQAEVVRLTTLRLTHAEIAAELALTEYDARRIAYRVEVRLRRTQSWIGKSLTEDLRAVLDAFRNTFNPKPSLPIYRKIPGGYDTVRFRAKPEGSLPEDLLSQPGYILNSLPRLLESRTMDAAG